MAPDKSMFFGHGYSEDKKTPEVIEIEQRAVNRRNQSKKRLQPTEEMMRFNTSLVESDFGMQDKMLLSVHGMLNPKGELFACQFGKHNILCKNLGYHGVYAMEEEGWIALSDMTWRVEPKYRVKRINRAQWSTIQSWIMNNGFSRNEFFELQDKSGEC